MTFTIMIKDEEEGGEEIPLPRRICPLLFILLFRMKKKEDVTMIMIMMGVKCWPKNIPCFRCTAGLPVSYSPNARLTTDN